MKEKQNKGFTLIEVVVAMSLFFILLSILGALNFSTSGFYKNAYKQGNIQNNLTIAIDRIRDELRNAEFRTIHGINPDDAPDDPPGSGIEAPAVSGTSSSITFYKLDTAGDEHKIEFFLNLPDSSSPYYVPPEHYIDPLKTQYQICISDKKWNGTDWVTLYDTKPITEQVITDLQFIRESARRIKFTVEVYYKSVGSNTAMPLRYISSIVVRE